MAFQFFARAHQSKAPTSPPLSPPQAPSTITSPSSNNSHTRPPKGPPAIVVPPSSGSSSVSLASKLQPPAGRDSTLQAVPYPKPIASGHPTPHPHVTVEVVSTAHIPSLTRITGLLLPIRYPNSFYTATITDPVISSLSRVAVYHDHPVAAAPTSAAPSPSTGLKTPTTGSDKVIGGIRCRLERLPPTTAGILQGRSNSEPTNLYIQTLHLLSPYRGCGIAASLLDSLLYSSSSLSSSTSSDPRPDQQVSDLVKHYNIRTVTAHVHEANEDGLKWYIARGFKVEDGIVENYYRRLKPSGAKIVKLVLQWTDAPKEEILPINKRQDQRKAPGGDDDDDWEKVEAEDGDDEEDHGVQPFADTDSKILEVDEGMSRKRKADDEPQRP
ncbi:GNAT family acetyltransferase [Aspergillus eucalypticola CBS 122712]|uniref:GNAT family acetyltransferase n=1 Tax=Aspergillus eucalypticola (strain CBS 122712 / IBT 29274) TaxID=1448314 RepID=A0A317VNH5_ASPEC|nr:GNAT family acetyltransferase [Aspergillus eucalypticola CBS 122712]PWY75893.1 GNAT family acetyltransferase [Aspergillus eucalypticola CBS 122712]